MKKTNTDKNEAIEGKTYTLRNGLNNSTQYYKKIRLLADHCLKLVPDTEKLLRIIHKYGNRKRFLPVQMDGPFANEIYRRVLRILTASLTVYTRNVKSHLSTLGIKRWTDPRLATTEEKYHLYMLEIELMNRLFSKDLERAQYKIAFLPHCLRDLSRKCSAIPDDLDYVCQSCSKECYINQVCEILTKLNVDAYIWMQLNLKSFLKKLQMQNRNFAVLGIACIPELVNGMRKCYRLNVPAVGIPLDANRCRRWMSEFYPTSVNLTQLKKLLNENIEQKGNSEILAE